MSDIKILTVAQACQELSLSEPTMRRRAKADPAFPQKISLSVRRVGYRLTDIQAYLARLHEEALAIHAERLASSAG